MKSIPDDAVLSIAELRRIIERHFGGQRALLAGSLRVSDATVARWLARGDEAELVGPVALAINARVRERKGR